jgi:hypothetical protein
VDAAAPAVNGLYDGYSLSLIWGLHGAGRLILVSTTVTAKKVEHLVEIPRSPLASTVVAERRCFVAGVRVSHGGGSGREILQDIVGQVLVKAKPKDISKEV